MHAAMKLSLLGTFLTLALTGCPRGTAECEEPNTVCGETCADLQSDPRHCGACDAPCGAGFVCTAGVCACAPGEEACGDACVNTSSDLRNCGGCGIACATGEACVDGDCGCAADQFACGDECVDLDSDPNNCGVCGQTCLAGQQCVNRACACTGSDVTCDGACVDLQSDAANCGACNIACDAGVPCVEGSCATPCGGEGQPACGTCDPVCTDGLVCVEGTCTDICTGLGRALCGGVCVDGQTDEAHCGACDVACGNGEVCVEGDCELACTAPKQACGGACFNVQTSSLHCGACDAPCLSGESCVEGACVACAMDELQCAGGCVDPMTDEAHCGACDEACGAGLQCLGGACVAGNLYGACFQSGEVIPLLRVSGTKTAPVAQGIDGPQSLAALDKHHLVAIGSLDQTLYVLDRATMAVVGSIGVGEAPNFVVVRGTRAYVVNSVVNTVQVIELANPASPASVDEVSVGSGKNPYAAAFDDAGTLWVSMLLTDEVTPIDFSGTLGVADPAIPLPPITGEGVSFPSFVAALGDTVYVTLNNLDQTTYAPAGNGRLATVKRSDHATALIDLGAPCKNPGGVIAQEGLLYVACSGGFAANEGTIAVFDPATSMTTYIPTGGSPSRLSSDPSRAGFLFASNSAGLDLFAIENGTAKSVVVCPQSDFEFVADILAMP